MSLRLALLLVSLLDANSNSHSVVKAARQARCYILAFSFHTDRTIFSASSTEPTFPCFHNGAKKFRNAWTIADSGLPRTVLDEECPWTIQTALPLTEYGWPQELQRASGRPGSYSPTLRARQTEYGPWKGGRSREEPQLATGTRSPRSKQTSFRQRRHGRPREEKLQYSRRWVWPQSSAPRPEQTWLWRRRLRCPGKEPQLAPRTSSTEPKQTRP